MIVLVAHTVPVMKQNHNDIRHNDYYCYYEITILSSVVIVSVANDSTQSNQKRQQPCQRHF